MSSYWENRREREENEKQKMSYKCPKCHKIIIEDLEKFLKENKSKEIECPYCFSILWTKNL